MSEPVPRQEPTAEGLARALSDALREGKHGKPVITERFGSTDGLRAGFVVSSAKTGESYRVTVESLA